jgi:GntR family transcriptional regulator
MTPLRTGSRRPPRIVREPGTSVPRQIEDWLAGQIATGALAPGDRLPTEHDLAGWFGVSRMTLRHALAELARRGLVTKTVGRHGGTVVAAAKLEQDLTTLAGFSEQLRRHGMEAGARALARGRPGVRGAAGPAG